MSRTCFRVCEHDIEIIDTKMYFFEIFAMAQGLDSVVAMAKSAKILKQKSVPNFSR